MQGGSGRGLKMRMLFFFPKVGILFFLGFGLFEQLVLFPVAFGCRSKHCWNHFQVKQRALGIRSATSLILKDLEIFCWEKKKVFFYFLKHSRALFFLQVYPYSWGLSPNSSSYRGWDRDAPFVKHHPLGTAPLNHHEYPQPCVCLIPLLLISPVKALSSKGSLSVSWPDSDTGIRAWQLCLVLIFAAGAVPFSAGWEHGGQRTWLGSRRREKGPQAARKLLVGSWYCEE